MISMACISIPGLDDIESGVQEDLSQILPDIRLIIHDQNGLVLGSSHDVTSLLCRGQPSTVLVSVR